MEYLRFTKMQGVGNDFVVVDGRALGSVHWPALAIEMCDRHKGVGADGLLVLDTSPNADFAMRMYNPDGTPDVCGNGLRCIARYATERGVTDSDSMRVQTLAGAREARLHRDAGGRVQAVTVNMGQPRFAPAEIPMLAETAPIMDYPLPLTDEQPLRITALSTGSTHTVTFVTELPDDAAFLRISPQVEHHALFPERTSLMWCMQESETRFRLRIWERGAGETWGCGTGACAAGVAVVLQGFAPPDQPLTIASKGGELLIRWKPGADIEMTGPAEVVYEGRYALKENIISTSSV